MHVLNMVCLEYCCIVRLNRNIIDVPGTIFFCFQVFFIDSHTVNIYIFKIKKMKITSE